MAEWLLYHHATPPLRHVIAYCFVQQASMTKLLDQRPEEAVGNG